MTFIHLDELQERIIETVKELDFDTLAQMAEHLLGGYWYWHEGDMFIYEPENDIEFIE